MRVFQPASHEEWLEFRRERLTSTELARLHLSRTARTWQEVRAEKDSGSSWAGNQYTAWGSAREPLLAPVVVGVDSRLVYNADPQTIVVNPDDARLCGTPDLYSEDGEVIGEIKTAKHMFTGGKFHDWCPDQYFLQVQANMLHCESEACVLLVEYYTESGGEFHPAGFERQIIRPDVQVQESMMDTAAAWFDWLDGVTPPWLGDDLGLDQVDQLAELVEAYAQQRDVADAAKDEMERLRGEILALTGESYADSIAGYKVSVSTSQPSQVLDSRALKAAQPDIYKEFCTKPRAGHTRVTIKKET